MYDLVKISSKMVFCSRVPYVEDICDLNVFVLGKKETSYQHTTNDLEGNNVM